LPGKLAESRSGPDWYGVSHTCSNHQENDMRNVPGVLIGVVLLASGCVIIGPDFIPPPAPVADAWLEKDEAQLTSATDHHEEWWSVFDDPVLNALVEEASLQNLGLQGAGLRILEARAQLGIATGNLYPQVQQLNAEASTVGGSISRI
jgi:outer membrane protein TolC